MGSNSSASIHRLYGLRDFGTVVVWRRFFNPDCLSISKTSRPMVLISTLQMAFAQNAIQLKRNAPGAHTFLEVIGLRWGTLCHLSFMFFGLGTSE